MKNISDLKVSQFRIFPIDVVPFHYLFVPAARERIQGAFNFKEAGKSVAQPRPPKTLAPITFPAENLFFGQGEFSFEKKVYPVESLVIEPRRILLTVVGSSKVANAVYDALTPLISEFDSDKQFVQAKLLVLFEETGCDVSLDINFEKLLSQEFVNLVSSEILPQLSSPLWQARIKGMRLGIEVSYALKDPALSDHDISLNPKVMHFQSAPGSPLEQKRYLTLSPADSDTHLRMIEKLEKLGQSVKSKR